jgi:hypothetical protein
MITFPFTRSMSNNHEANRSLVLVDLENLIGGAANKRLVAATITQLMTRPWAQDGSLIIVGTGPTLAETAMFSVPPSWRYVIGRGLNGADNALLQAAEPLLDRVGRLVIASGDHAFERAAQSLPRHLVNLLAPIGGAARGLQRCAGSIDYIRSFDVSLAA